MDKASELIMDNNDFDNTCLIEYVFFNCQGKMHKCVEGEDLPPFHVKEDESCCPVYLDPDKEDQDHDHNNHDMTSSTDKCHFVSDSAEIVSTK